MVICLQRVADCLHMVHCIPKPRHLLPHLNPDWFYLSFTGLPRLSWKRTGTATDVVAAVGLHKKLCIVYLLLVIAVCYAFSALTLLVGRQEGHSAYKK